MNKQRVTIQLVLREQFVKVDAIPLPPDRSVGIMEWSFEDEIVTDVFGQDLNWNLTDEEVEIINNLIHNGKLENDNR